MRVLAVAVLHFAYDSFHLKLGCTGFFIVNALVLSTFIVVVLCPLSLPKTKTLPVG